MFIRGETMKNFAKRVELTELFYDLVFVYAISQVTGLIHHLPEGSTFGLQFVIFTVVMIVFINTWMFETVFTNRFGKNSLTNIAFFMVDMAIVLFMANNFVGPIQQWFMPFTIAASLLSLTLVMQYCLEYFRPKNEVDKKLSRVFIFILSIRTVLLLIGGLLPIKFGIIVALLGVILGWVLPGFFSPVMRPHPINFPHLLERMTALSIILFGETIVDISPYFVLKEFTIYSVLIFLIVCSLFMNYITQFDHFIDEHQTGETGNRLIYLHYPIVFGISLVTVSLSFIHESEIDQSFAVVSLYAGIILFYIGLFIADYYNKETMSKKTFVVVTFLITTILGLILSLILKSFAAVTIITALVTFINAFTLSGSMVGQINAAE